MSAIKSESMDSLMASLSTGFGKVPPAAIPAMLDCILASTGLSPPSLFASLLNVFPTLIKDIIKEDQKLGSDGCNYLTSLVVAICHLLKKIGANNIALQSFMSRIFIPLLKIVHAADREMLNQIAESFIDVVIGTDSWAVVEETLVQFFLRYVDLSTGMLEKKGSDAFESSVFQGLNDLTNDVGVVKEHMMSPSGPFPLPISCHILTLMLDAALQSLQAAPISEFLVAHGSFAEKFAANLILDLCNVTEGLLVQSVEHRSCAIGFFLPIIFKAFVSYQSFEISIHGQTCILSRKCFLKKIWKCCRKLFSLGPLERRDAYNVLSLYLSFFPCTEEYEDVDTSRSVEAFDIRAEKEFWDEIRRGLVDKEGLVRKQSLQILKNALHLNGGSQPSSGDSELKLREGGQIPRSMTKREFWADKEAKSMGVGKICNTADIYSNSQQQWEAFILLYEMLEEYGTHLVEAAWNHQVSLLLQFSMSHVNFASSVDGGVHQSQIEASGAVFNWLSILWERGFCHDNPLVRCLIMQSFLGIEWKHYGNCAKSVPETFVLGPFIQGLNDPVHHKDFGVKGVYSSRIIEGAAWFLHQYTSCLSERKRIAFLCNLASVAKWQSFCRAGLVGLAECVASAASGSNGEAKWREDAFLEVVEVEIPSESFPRHDKTILLDVLRFVIESSKQHFNPNYRFRVCDKILEAAASMVCTFEVPLEILLHFISALPREFTDYGGSLRVKVQEWLSGCGKKHCSANCCNTTEVKLLKSLHDFPKRFTSCNYLIDASLTYNDEDLDAWKCEAKRWARVLFLAVKKDHHLIPLFTFIQNHGSNICKQNNDMEWIPVKFLIITLSLVMELQIMQKRAAECGNKVQSRSESSVLETVVRLNYGEAAISFEKFPKIFLLILEELISFANMSCSIFSSSTGTEDKALPSSVRGKLGGPSQRRLSSSATAAVLQAETAMKSVAAILSWCAQFKSDVSVNFAFSFLWKFFLKTVTSPSCDSETGAEICLAAYEALTPVLRALVSIFSPQVLDTIRENDKVLLPKVEGTPLLDSLALSFLQNINTLLAVGVLARARRAVLMNAKWLGLESLLSIPSYARATGLHLEDTNGFFSDAILRLIFTDLVESLENAGEVSVLSMLRSVRLVLGLFAEGTFHSVSSHNGVDVQMMWHLVHSSWILHVSCNKRRVAPIAALLSSVLHCSVFGDEKMHVANSEPGPLKWFIDNVIEEGKKSPRTIRLAALHLTGLWLSNPRTIKYYMKELKLLSLYGSVAFDEDFEGELADNFDARSEVSLLAKSADPELSEAFINTELYGRVSVAVLFYKLADLADMVGSKNETEDCHAALESGKLFLQELLDSAVNDKDLAKELYKKYSAIHRRKIRAWQMICVLSRFARQDVVGHVTRSLHISLNRNNLPAVRQYLETFAINIYLKFPSLVGEQLVPILRDYDMRPQALSSYVFIAANVILHASEAVQFRHLNELLPPIVPFLTSHHHSLRGFTQLLVYQVLCKLFPTSDSGASQIILLEKRCFEDLKSYLAKNSDCVRLRASMEGYLDAYNPKSSVTPAGIFINRVEELEFECVPISLMEQVLTFLNDAREDLRCSMARDVVTIKNESIRIDEDPDCMELSYNAKEEKLLSQLPKDACLDFQKKVTLSKHEKKDNDASSFFGNKVSYEQLVEMEKDDQLLNQFFQSRSLAMERIRASQQPLILVASLLDRIPNLAGLARTCEVFKASGLAIADANILRDKQFQLISVTAEKWVPIIEVPVNSVKVFLEKKKREGFSILGLEQTANSIPLDQYVFPTKTVLVLGREKEGIPVDIIHVLDACIEIPQLGVVRSLNVHVSGAIALWEYTRQQRSQQII